MIWGVNRYNQIFFQRSEKAAYEKTWTKVEGGLKQISTGPVGTFGVNRHNEIFYRRGTHEDNFLSGYEWQKLPGKLKYISVGLNSVWGVNSANQIWYLDSFILKWGKLDFSKGKMHWKLFPGGLKQISASKNSDVVWGVNNKREIWFKADLNPRSHFQKVGILHRFKQVEVGNLGVFAIRTNGAVYYRSRTYGRPWSAGSGWIRVPGSYRRGDKLSHITVGRHGLWGCKRNEIFRAAFNSHYARWPKQIKWHKMPGGLKQISAYWISL